MNFINQRNYLLFFSQLDSVQAYETYLYDAALASQNMARLYVKTEIN